MSGKYNHDHHTHASNKSVVQHLHYKHNWLAGGVQGKGVLWSVTMWLMKSVKTKQQQRVMCGNSRLDCDHVQSEDLPACDGRSAPGTHGAGTPPALLTEGPKE